MARPRNPVVLVGVPPPKIIRPGMPTGIGSNQKLLAKIKPGELQSCIWGCTERKMKSLKTTASRDGMLLKVRLLSDGKYAIWRKT